MKNLHRSHIWATVKNQNQSALMTTLNVMAFNLENPTTSSRRLSAQLNVDHATLRRIIHDYLGVYPYRLLSTKI